ncbi:MAG: hypothetical protein ACYCSJ_07740, partial [Acidimicrobiales bacterium]
IKTARELALLPYTQRTVSERAGGGRGGRGGRGRRDEGEGGLEVRSQVEVEEGPDGEGADDPAGAEDLAEAFDGVAIDDDAEVGV